MGDNIYLGDRNGVRTPMQWSPDRNGGFSRADPQRLYLPAIMDPVYGYEADQRRGAGAQSVLAAELDEAADRRAQEPARLRPRHAALPASPATARCWPTCASTRDEIILCVANLARTPQAVELDLRRLQGTRAGGTDGPHALPADRRAALSAHPAGLRLLLASASPTDVDVPRWHEERCRWRRAAGAGDARGLAHLLHAREWRHEVERAMAGRTRDQLQQEVLPPYLNSRRWFAGKGHAIRRIEIAGGRRMGLSRRQLAARPGASRVRRHRTADLFLPLAIAWERQRREQLRSARRLGAGQGAAEGRASGLLYVRVRRRRVLPRAGAGDEENLEVPLARVAGCASARPARIRRLAADRRADRQSAGRRWSKATSAVYLRPARCI